MTNVVSQWIWEQTYQQAVFQISSQSSGSVRYLWVYTISKMKKAGEKLGNFLDMDYESAKTAAISLHPNANLVVGLRLMDKGEVEESITPILALGSWKAWQKKSIRIGEKGFIPEVYAIPQRYVIY